MNQERRDKSKTVEAARKAIHEQRGDTNHGLEEVQRSVVSMNQHESQKQQGSEANRLLSSRQVAAGAWADLGAF
eukprot:10166127-Heterocapsa_arctica.AAC.1